MHETTLADAFRPAQYYVLGLPLMPYSLGHDIALIARRNALVTNPYEKFKSLHVIEREVALANAVLVCRKEVKGWFGRNRFNQTRWEKSIARMDFRAETDKFMEYLYANSLDLPVVSQPRVQGTPFHYLGAPEVARLLNYVTTHHQVMIATHFENSPLNFPFGLAKILFSTHCETEGAIWVKNQTDYTNEARHRMFTAANPDGGVAIGPEATKAAAEKWNLEHPDQKVPVE